MHPCDHKNIKEVQLNHTDITIIYCPQCGIMRLIKNDYNDDVYLDKLITDEWQKKIYMYLFK